MGRGEGGGGGAVAVGGDQLGDLALVEALAQAPWTFCVRSRGVHVWVTWMTGTTPVVMTSNGSVGMDRARRCTEEG